MNTPPMWTLTHCEHFFCQQIKWIVQPEFFLHEKRLTNSARLHRIESPFTIKKLLKKTSEMLNFQQGPLYPLHYMNNLSNQNIICDV